MRRSKPRGPPKGGDGERRRLAEGERLFDREPDRRRRRSLLSPFSVFSRLRLRPFSLSLSFSERLRLLSLEDRLLSLLASFSRPPSLSFPSLSLRSFADRQDLPSFSRLLLRSLLLLLGLASILPPPGLLLPGLQPSRPLPALLPSGFAASWGLLTPEPSGGPLGSAAAAAAGCPVGGPVAGAAWPAAAMGA